MALALYNHASAADDYCHIDTVFKYGWMGGIKAYYTGWSGRYFSIFLNHSNPLLFHWFAGFKWLPFFLYTGIIASFFWLVRTLNPDKKTLVNLGIASLLFYLLILRLPSILEAFFWTAAVVNYTVPNILTLLWILVAIKRETPGRPPLVVKGLNLLAFLLVFAINGTSENNVFVIMILIIGWLGYRLVWSRKLDPFYLSLLIWGIVTALFSFLSVGNAVRFEGNPQSRNFLFAFIESFKFAPKLLFGWITNPSFLVITLLSLGLFPSFLKKGTDSYNAFFNINPFYTMLVTTGVVVSQIFPSYYGIGVYPTPRVINCIYFFFLWGWFYNLGVVLCYLDKRKLLRLTTFPRIPFLLKPLLCLVLLWDFYHAENSRLMYRELLTGEAAAYSEEMTERTRLLMTSPSDTLYLAPLRHQPQTLFLEDMKADPGHLWNRCIAGYFGKKAIYIAEPRRNDQDD